MALILTTETNPGAATWSEAVGTQRPFVYYAENFDSPTLGVPDWIIDTLAPATVDTNNAALINRAFRTSSDEAIGINQEIPEGATNLHLRFNSRADVAPGVGTDTVQPQLYIRVQCTDPPAAVGAWSAPFDLVPIVLPVGTEFFQKDTQMISLAALGLVPGDVYQILLVREIGGPNDLTSSWLLHSLSLMFS